MGNRYESPKNFPKLELGMKNGSWKGAHTRQSRDLAELEISQENLAVVI